MIIKINRRSSGTGATAYLLSLLNWVNETRPAKPEILYGDAEIFEESARISGYSQPYLSGEASWGEDIIKVGRKIALACVMAFIRLLTARIALAEFAFLIVLHSRKQGFDIHFVVSKVHLKTGLQFRLYRDTDYDEAFKRTFCRRANLVHGWSDQEDPENRSLRTHPSPYAKPAERRAHEEFDDRMVQWVRSGFASSYDQLVALIQSQGLPLKEIQKENGVCGIEVTYEGHTITLLGGKYTRGFDYEAARCHRTTRRERSRKDIDREIGKLGRKLARYGSRREAEYKAAFAGGSRLFDGDPKAGVEYDGEGVPDRPGEFGEPGETIYPLASVCTGGGAAESLEAVDHGHAPGAGLRPSVSGCGGVDGAPRAGRGESNLGAPISEDARDAEPPADVAGDPPSHAAGPKEQNHALPSAGGDLGGSGTGREARPDGHVLPISGGHPPGVAHPSQTAQTIIKDAHHEHGNDIYRIATITAELLRRLGQALSDAEQNAAAAEQTLGDLAEGADREREVIERIGGNLSEAGIGVPGVEKTESRGKNPVDDDYKAACREFGRAVEEIGEGDYEALEPDAAFPPRPPLPTPEGGPKGFEPSR